MSIFDILRGLGNGMQKMAGMQAERMGNEAVKKMHESHQSSIHTSSATSNRQSPQLSDDEIRQQIREKSKEGLTKKQIEDNRLAVELATDDYDYEISGSGHYRDTALENTSSNYGWYTCPKCGRKFRRKDMDADHIVPQSKGGDDSRYNLQMLCAHCNRSKQDDMSDTKEDLARRRKEIYSQDEDDIAMLNFITKEQENNH